MDTILWGQKRRMKFLLNNLMLCVMVPPTINQQTAQVEVFQYQIQNLLQLILPKKLLIMVITLITRLPCIFFLIITFIKTLSRNCNFTNNWISSMVFLKHLHNGFIFSEHLSMPLSITQI